MPELVRRLADDSRRLAADEMRLAKLEVGENLNGAARGAMWLGASFGIGVVAAVALTIFLVALIGSAAGGRYWIGALVVGVVELVGALLCIRGGIGRYKAIDFTFSSSRESFQDTAEWAAETGRAVKTEVARQPAHARAAIREGLADAGARPPRAD